MVDNQHNYFNNAPDKGRQNGPVWAYSGSFENYMENLRSGRVVQGSYDRDLTPTAKNTLQRNHTSDERSPQKLSGRGSGYWLPTLAALGSQPLAGSDYKFYRNVLDYKADNSGNNDATEAINAAVQDGNRCGKECGNSFTQGAIIYFPAGTYKICSPVIQLYYTQFIGDATNPPTIKGCDNFTGIALFDTDPYIPGGAGAEWYKNQNQFFRHIRNFVFDMTSMPLATSDGAQTLVPTGIHWQAAQATTLQNLVFKMPHADNANAVNHVGIFTENGSGGFVSDLTFSGGAIGWRAGEYSSKSSQGPPSTYARLQDPNIQMVWDWGFNWQGIEIHGGIIGFNITGRGGDRGQGTGSVSIIDCSINDVPTAILTTNSQPAPNIVLDNLFIDNVAQVVQQDGGSTLLTGSTGSQTIDLWGTGLRYNGSSGSSQTGWIVAPPKASGLLSGRSLYVRSRPQYESLGADSFLIATDNGIKNDGTGDQVSAINSFLLKARDAGQIAYFPAGIYQVGSTVFIPTGSRVQGSSWSQIQGAGFYFSDMNNPRVVVQVGNKGDVGDMEIVEMLFTVRGPPPEQSSWNGMLTLEVRVQVLPAMWDSHFRVGGGNGTDLDAETCPKGRFNENCIAASLMFHVTSQASGYFENVWAWVADHDNDYSVYHSPDKLVNQISVYGARGMLIESQGPSWFYGTSSEHSVMYNYQLNKAKNIYLGHIQTETPYYQPNPAAPVPFTSARSFNADPSFDACTTDACKASWGLRVVDSTNITLHGVGLYSFFRDYRQDCTDTEDCQERILEVTGSSNVVLYNIFTVATTEVAFLDVASLTSPPQQHRRVSEQLSKVTWTYITSIEYGNTGSTTNSDGQVITTFFTTITTITVTIPPITTTAIPYANVDVTKTETSGGFTASPRVTIPPIGVPLPDGNGGTTTRSIQLPPWPDVTNGPPENWGNPTDPFGTGANNTGLGTYYAFYNTTVTATKPTITTLSFPSAIGATTISCPPNSEVVLNSPRTTLDLLCTTPTAISYSFSCQASKVVTFLGPSAGAFTIDCTVVTEFPTIPLATTSGPSRSSTSSSTTVLPVWTTWPPGLIVPVTTSVEKPRPTDNGVVVPCNLWFFFICISGIGGWHWILPPGIYPPGPPPSFIQWPKPLGVKGTLPPWPKITIGPDNELTYPDDPTSSCTTRTGSVCTTTTFVSATVTGGTTTTTTSTSYGGCEAIEGCEATNSDTAITSSTTAACTPTASADSLNVCDNDALVYPRDPANVGDIPTILAKYSGKYEQAEFSGETAFFWVPVLDQDTFDKLKASSNVYDVQYYERYNKAVPLDIDENPPPDTPLTPDPGLKRHRRRDYPEMSKFGSYERSLNSLAKGQAWRSAKSQSYITDADEKYQYWYNSTAGYDSGLNEGYSVYIINEDWVYSNHPEWTANGAQGKVELLSPGYSFNDPAPPPKNGETHGSGVAAHINGHKAGTCKRCRVVWFQTQRWTGYPEWVEIRSQFLLHAYKAYEDIVQKGLKGKAVINMSFSSTDRVTPAALRAFKYILDKLDHEQQVVLVAASGNLAAKEGKEITRYPARFGSANPSVNPYGQIKNLIVVGAINAMGYEADFSQTSAYLTTYSPGTQVSVPTDPDANPNNPWEKEWGTSFAAPAVAGIAAYLRSLDSPFKTSLEDPANVKLMIEVLAHRFDRLSTAGRGVVLDPARKRPVAWNGQVQNWQTDADGQNITQSHSCLADWDTRTQWDDGGACSGLNPDMTKMGESESTGSCDANGHPLSRRDAGGSCPLDPQGGGGSGSGSGTGISITFASGATASPTCASAGGCGGTVCTGFYCTRLPTGVPPDFWDPKDPNNGQPVPTTTIGTTPTSSPTSTCDDRCKVDNGYPCTCNESWCDAKSPACCVDASCPLCDCGASGCVEGSPACCASHTCAWSWTGGGGGYVPIPAQLRIGSVAISSAPTSAYSIWSTEPGSEPFTLFGFDGLQSSACNQSAAGWRSSAPAGSDLQTAYGNVTVYGDACNYLASVATYDGVVPGALVGSLRCGRWSPATCYRGDYTAVQACGSSGSSGVSMTEQLICRWS
ncbi:hypothetical protein EKO27_g11198 [Xylaria grammica]|uniref:Pectate lyase superfamily protein domain-containing protein n=1 Tax=Xylaria grammica TaxID=363999 RepID=A0A439CP18_9PEZI|nr:hypothetical protein EKO27_g11198 [Xylaria grammica]